MNALIPLNVHPRPSVISLNGWVEFVSVHDREHLRVKREWKKRLANNHPDRSKRGGSQLFRRLSRSYQVWEEGEKKYYERLGLSLPGWNR